MPTLFDIDDFDSDPTCPTANAVSTESDLDSDLSLTFEDWNDDEDETCFDVA